MMFVRLPILTAFLLFLSVAYAQELPSNTQQQMESMAEWTENDIEDDALLQQLVGFRSRPLNLNEANADDLQVFPFLSALQIQNFLAYRNTLGKLLTIYELQSVPAWDIPTIHKLLPYITIVQQVNIPKRFFDRMKGGEHTMLLRTSHVMEKAKGFDTTLSNHYLGDRRYMLFRYQYRFNNLLQYGITAEKDAGEQFFKGAQVEGFDFYSVHLFARNLGNFKAIAIGDFSVNLGQGLVQWQSLAFAKGAEVASIKKQAPVLKPYTSAGELNFNRGGGITFQKGRIEATVFASLHKIDANTALDSAGEEIMTSFISSGLHRTASEIEEKHNSEQTSYGGNLSWKSKSFHIGFNTVSHSFSRSMEKRRESYNLYALKGNSFFNMSMDYSYTYKNIHFFGEFAVDKKFHRAFLNGILASLDPKVDVSLLHRYYTQDYTTVYGKAFSENTIPANETGFYLGMRLRPTESLSFSAYSDLYQFGWLKYRTDAPSIGRDYFVQLTYQPNKQLEFYTRYKNERKAINESIDNSVTNEINAKLKQQWRMHLTYVLSKKFTWQNRVDVVWYDKGGSREEEGFLFYTDGSYQPTGRFSVNGRVAFFETSGFNTRIYTYENDVLYSYSTPFYSGNGFRYYLNFNYDISKYCSLWLKTSRTNYKDQSGVGSGINEIEGNKKSEIRVQALLRI